MGLFGKIFSNSKDIQSDKKNTADVEIENSYFGNGILVKDLNSEGSCYKDIKSGLDGIFDSFGKKSDTQCDLYEFIVKEDNLEFVITSLEKIYENSNQIMESCYNEIYSEIFKFFEENYGESLKDEFDLEYLKENWYVNGLAIYDDHAEFSIGINAAKNQEDDSCYEIYIYVDYSTQEPEVSFNVVW